MWSIVEFVDDKTVEAVPNYWFKNQKCAWPKKNIKKMIQTRVYPNVLDFNFYAARKIGKDIGMHYIELICYSVYYKRYLIKISFYL